MKHALSILALALVGCGGGGSGSGGNFVEAPATSTATAAAAAPASAAPVAATAPAAATQAAATPATAAQTPPIPVNTSCAIALDGHVACDLIADSQPIGVGVPAGSYVEYVNRTGAYLQINSVSAFTGETQDWSEICTYSGTLITGQTSAGVGEVGCSPKNPGESYAPMTWGDGTGLSVAPGGVIYLNSHTEPGPENHTYFMSVAPQTTGLFAWRQPQMDQVFVCDGLPQSEAWTPWKNTTARILHVKGADIYVASGTATPTELAGPACLYVLNPDGTIRLQQCDDALRTRGQTAFYGIDLMPGESIAVQAVNTCAGPSNWGWVAYLQVWG